MFFFSSWTSLSYCSWTNVLELWLRTIKDSSWTIHQWHEKFIISRTTFHRGNANHLTTAHSHERVNSRILYNYIYTLCIVWTPWSASSSISKLLKRIGIYCLLILNLLTNKNYGMMVIYISYILIIQLYYWGLFFYFMTIFKIM